MCLLTLFTSYQPYIMFFATLTPTWKCVHNSTLCLWTGEHDGDNMDRCNVPRHQWYYTQPKQFSLVTWFDISCDQHWFVGATSTIYFFGTAVGALGLGRLADKKGRRAILIPGSGIIMLFGLLIAFATNIYVILLFRFILGFFHMSVKTQVIVLMLEIVGPEHRNIASIGPYFFYPIGFSVLSLKAYLFKDWKMLCIATTAPYAFLLVLMCWFVPESVKWLHEKGHTEEATQTLRRIASCNKKELPADFSLSPVAYTKPEEFESSSIPEMKPSVITRLFVQTLIKVSKVAVFYGLIFAAHKLPGDVYLNSFLLNIFELPGTIIAISWCNKYSGS